MNQWFTRQPLFDAGHNATPNLHHSGKAPLFGFWILDFGSWIGGSGPIFSLWIVFRKIRNPQFEIRNRKIRNPKSAIGKSAIGKSAIGKSAIGKSAIGKSAIGKSAIGKSAIEQ